MIIIILITITIIMIKKYIKILKNKIILILDIRQVMSTKNKKILK